MAERLIAKLGVDVRTAAELRALPHSQYIAAYGATAIQLTEDADPAEDS